MNFSLIFLCTFCTVLNHRTWKKLYLSILFLLAGVGSVFSQDVEQAVRERLQAFFQTYIPVNVNIGTCRLDSVLIDFHRKNNPHLCR